MNEEEVMRTIAEWMGWKELQPLPQVTPNWWGGKSPNGTYREVCFEYTRSLDALQPVLAKFTEAMKVELYLKVRREVGISPLQLFVKTLTLPAAELARMVAEIIRETKNP